MGSRLLKDSSKRLSSISFFVLSAIFMMIILTYIATASDELRSILHADFLSIISQQEALLTTDTLIYSRAALEASASPTQPIEQALSQKSGFTLMNWAGIVSLGAVVVHMFGQSGIFNFWLINAFLLLLTLYNYVRIMGDVMDKRTYMMFFLFGITPYILPNIVGLNKEIISIWWVSAMSLAMMNRNFLYASLLTVFIYFFRSHYVFIVFLTLLINYSGGRRLFVLLLLAVAVSLFGVSLSAEQFFSENAQRMSISTRDLMIYLDSIRSLPLGYFLVFFVRFGLNMIGPVYQIADLFRDFSVIRFLYVLYGIAILYNIFNLIKESVQVKHMPNGIIFHFFVASAFVICLTPFLQPRYFLPFIPLIFISHKAMKISRVRNARVSDRLRDERSAKSALRGSAVV